MDAANRCITKNQLHDLKARFEKLPTYAQGRLSKLLEISALSHFGARKYDEACKDIQQLIDVETALYGKSNGNMNLLKAMIRLVTFSLSKNDEKLAFRTLRELSDRLCTPPWGVLNKEQFLVLCSRYSAVDHMDKIRTTCNSFKL